MGNWRQRAIKSNTLLGIGDNYNEKFYFLRGGTNNTFADIYDVKTDAWSTETINASISVVNKCVSTSANVFGFDFNNKKYIKGPTGFAIASISQAIPTGSQCASSGHIYFVGGSNSASTKVIQFTGTAFSQAGNHPGTMLSFGCAAVGGNIYCIGGTVDNKSATHLNVYNIGSKTWSTGSELPQQRLNSICTVFNGKIYCFCGTDAVTKEYLYDVMIYDPETDSWEFDRGVEIPFTSVLACNVYSNKIYLFGSFGSEPRGMQYDPLGERDHGTVYYNFEWEDGTTIQQRAYIEMLGQPYSAPKSTILNKNTYHYLGYRYNGGELIETEFKGVESVEEYQTITYVYRKTIPITIEYSDQNGTAVRNTTTVYVPVGHDLEQVAPKINSYKRVGYRLDYGDIFPTRTIKFTDIQHQFIVTFVYEPCDGENCVDPDPFTITEQYYDIQNEEYFRSDTYSYVVEGEDYVKVAPRLGGYRRMGHYIDDGGAVTTRTARIDDVEGNHTVTFLYEPCTGDNCVDPEDGGPGPGDGGGTDPGDGGGTDPGDGGGTDPGDGGGTDPGDGGGTDPGDGGGTDPGDGGGTDPGDGGGTDPGDGGGTDPGDGGGTDPGDGGGTDPGDGGGTDPGDGGGTDPGDGGGTDPGDGGGTDPGDGGGTDPGDGGGTDPGDGGGTDPGDGGGTDTGDGGDGGNKRNCCCCNCMPTIPCMPMMVMPVMMMPCMPMMPQMPQWNWSNCCTCCNCGTTTTPDPPPTNPAPNPDDEDDCE